MTERAPALFDVEPLRKVDTATLGVLAVDDLTIVLGSSQDLGDLAMDVVDADRVNVRRRRGGGGAVLLAPGDCWVELWLPRSDLVADDVRATAYMVGGWWQSTMQGHGIGASIHRGAVLDAAQGAIACFAGLGPGELTVGGAKLLGLSQWRARSGVLISSVVCAERPAALARYLKNPTAVPGLLAATSLDVVGTSAVGRDALAAAFQHEATGAFPDLSASTLPFT